MMLHAHRRDSSFHRSGYVLLSDEEYRQLQLALATRPEQGALIHGSGGLRKLRWGARGHGKRGGVRVIYYWHRGEQFLYMLLVYAKARQHELTPTQARVLRRLVMEEFG
jgi:mRNA-degrading endonuclease RelE of RelBE toxin-antitoxin system